MDKKMISALVLILSIAGITFYVNDNGMILVDKFGKNVTLNYTEVEDKTINDVIIIINNKTQYDIENRLKSFDYTSLIDCEVGDYKFGNIKLVISRYPFYNLCVIDIVDTTYLINYPIDKEFSDYLYEYYDLEDNYDDIEFVNYTKEIKLNVSALELDKYNIKSINKKTGPLQYEIITEKQYLGYDVDNKYITQFIDSNRKMSLDEILNHVHDCSLFDEWNNKWNNEKLPNNKEVYEIINEVCK